MKLAKSLLAVALVLVMALSVCACSVELGGEETWNYSADDKDGTVELFNNFTEKTFADTNQVVTLTEKGKEVFTETIDGTSSHSVFNTGVFNPRKTDTYAFKDGKKYIFASSDGETQYYMEGKKNYEMGYRAYKKYLEMFDLNEAKDVTFSAKVDGKKENEKAVSKETLKIEMKKGKSDSLTISATSEDGLVKKLTYTVNSKDEKIENEKITLDFTYGSAKVKIPDISKWTKSE